MRNPFPCLFELFQDFRDRLLCVFLRHPSWTVLEGQPLTPEEKAAFESQGFECVPVTGTIAVCDRCGTTRQEECQE